MKKIIFALALIAGLTVSTKAFSASKKGSVVANPDGSVTVSLLFSEYNAAKEKFAFNWPFEEISEEISNTIKTPSFSGKEKTFVIPGTSGTQKVEVFGSVGMVKNTKGGLFFGGKPGDYFLLPSIQGKSLVSLKIVTGNVGKDSPQVVLEDGSAVEGGAVHKSPYVYDETIEWTLSGAPAGSRCKILLPTERILGIRSLEAIYK